VHFGTAATVGLKSALGHDLVGLLLSIVCAGQTTSIKEYGPFMPVWARKSLVAGNKARSLCFFGFPAFALMTNYDFVSSRDLLNESENKKFATCFIPTPGKSFLKLHTTGTLLSIGKYRQELYRNPMLHHARDNYKRTDGRKYVRRFSKKFACEKKLRRCHFKRLKFVLVCRPVRKKLVAQRSVQRFCVALAEFR